MYKKLFSILYIHIIYIVNTIINIKCIFFLIIDYINNIYGLYMYIFIKYIECYICKISKYYI